jgi:hypothetical protein
MEFIQDSMDRPSVCEPGREATEAAGYDVKRVLHCPDRGAGCAVHVRRILGLIPLSKEYVACVGDQIPDVIPDVSHEATDS